MQGQVSCSLALLAAGLASQRKSKSILWRVQDFKKLSIQAGFSPKFINLQSFSRRLWIEELAFPLNDVGLQAAHGDKDLAAMSASWIVIKSITTLIEAQALQAVSVLQVLHQLFSSGEKLQTKLAAMSHLMLCCRLIFITACAVDQKHSNL